MSETLNQAREHLRPYVEKARGFSGWSNMPMSRIIGQPLPWDYAARARDLMSSAESVLDIGTGGGERLSVLLAGFEGRAIATEEWSLNAPVAAALLRPLGVDVAWSADEHLPFTSGAFDLVLNRHSSLDPGDVARVLRSGGTVLTQQVGTSNWVEVRDHFERAPDQRDLWGDHWELYRTGFEAGGLVIADARIHENKEAYDGLGDFVYMLCITPWTIPDFDPLGVDLEALLRLERELMTPEGLALTHARYIVEARKP